MSSRLNPYISFRDDAREALEFYQSVFGGELTLSTFDEIGASDDPAEAKKILHGMLETPSGFTLMAADTPNSMQRTAGDTMSVSLSGDDEAELTGYYEKLVAGGTSPMPLNKAPWGDTFGMCVDRFGVGWMVNIAGSPS